ncbi:MAG: VWA domain-containing protein [Saprospiraceae bacterium]|nr:VWA domain-containing protein [Saprospiraceae bacterium]
MKTKILFVTLFFQLLLWSCHNTGGNFTLQEESLAPIPESPRMYDEEQEMSEAEPQHNTEEYDIIRENEFLDAKQNPLSTFSIDVDNASYSNIRRYLDYEMPPVDAVRIEEMVNYFSYDYPAPNGKHPFSLTTEVAAAPWNKEHMLVHIGMQGKKLDLDNLKASNFVFLIDCSGSMGDSNKLPLLKKSLRILLEQLGDQDRIAVVAYAGAAGLVLPSTPATEKRKILAALDKLDAGGSTAGGEGIQLAYEVAKENLIVDGNNRVILATDGDFNVGVSSSSDLVRLIEEKRKDNIYLTICGLGMGNYKDGRMEQISNAGNGNYFYIDDIREAEKVFGREMRANMFTIAKDVKLQVEFNPAAVKAYRLIGYENRRLANEDFDDDLKDAGELGAGHTVTALYEIIPQGSAEEVRLSADLKYQQTSLSDQALNSQELLTLKLRYKPLDAEKSILLEEVIANQRAQFDASSDNFQFSAAVAGFGLLLRESRFKGDITYERVAAIARQSIGADPNGDRAEFVQLVRKASLLDD